MVPSINKAECDYISLLMQRALLKVMYNKFEDLTISPKLRSNVNLKFVSVKMSKLRKEGMKYGARMPPKKKKNKIVNARWLQIIFKKKMTQHAALV